MLKKWCFGFVVLFFWFDVFSQSNFSRPFIYNFSNIDYNAGTQNWCISQNRHGVMFFANNNGLLEYNGSQWKVHPLPNRTICRSVLVDSNKVFVGGQGELGYFENISGKQLQFISLINDSLIKEGIGDVWKIEKINSSIYFFSQQGIIMYSIKNEKIDFIKTSFSWQAMSKFNGGLLLQSTDSGFYKLKGKKLFSLTYLDSSLAGVISAVLPISKNRSLITTLNSGIFEVTDSTCEPWETNYDDFFRKNTIYNAIIDGSKKLFCATSQGGLLVIDSLKQGSLLLNKSGGLQNNNILSLFLDRDKNLWLGLDNGIDHVIINSAFSSFFPDGMLEGTSYSADVHKNNLYIGTNNGLFYTPWRAIKNPLWNSTFYSVNYLSGQVWNISSHNNNLFVNHHKGLFHQTDSGFYSIGSDGSWLIQPLKEKSNHFIEGTYHGINHYEIENDSIKKSNKIEGFLESSRYIVQDALGYIWVAHPYKGIYRCKPDSGYERFIEIKKFGKNQGLLSEKMLKVFELNKQIYFVAEKGIYVFDYQKEVFKIDTLLTEILSENAEIRYLSQGFDESVWFVDGDDVGVLKVSYNGIKQNIEKIIYPQLKGKLVNGFEFIKQVNTLYTILGAKRGMILFNNSYFDSLQVDHYVLLNTVQAFGEADSILSERYLFSGENKGEALPYKFNNLSFSFSAPIFNGKSQIEYSYYLEGFENEWCDWTKLSTKEYTNLPPGKYSFKVKARLPHFIETQPTIYYFKIIPPWYRSRVAYIIYIILILIVIFSLVIIPRRRYEKEKRFLKKQQERKLQQKDIEHKNFVELSENEKIKLVNEKLQTEINFKTKELASSTMHLVQKTEILSKIKTELSKTAQETNNKDAVTNQLKKIIKLIDANVRLDKNWAQFEMQFDQVHVNFNKRLKEQFPDLSPNDLKLCAYLRMNLTTKEIAPLLNISVRGVEISRYRLRKKLNLDRDENLYEFLSEV